MSFQDEGFENKNGSTIYVGGIPETFKDSDLVNLFIPFGFISSVKIPQDPNENKNRGFAFVEFENKFDADEAIFNMNNSELVGNLLKVNIAAPDKTKDMNKAVWESDNHFEDNEKAHNIDNDKNLSEKSNIKTKTVEQLDDNELKNKSFVFTYFDIEIDRKKSGRLVLKLNYDVCPKTVNNFVQLCTGVSMGGFKSSYFHRIVSDFMAQGGDFTKGDGTGGFSIYGRKFDDENFILKHDKRGIISMANSGPDSNGSQFFIIFAPAPHLDDKHVVFGEVYDGFDVLDRIESAASGNGKPKKTVKIADCGIFQNSNLT